MTVVVESTGSTIVTYTSPCIDVSVSDTPVPPPQVLRVAHVVDELASAGAQRVLLANLAAFDPERVRSEVFHVYPRDDLRSEIEALGVKTTYLGARNATDLPKAALGLWHQLRSRPVDVVHTQVFPADICGRLAGRAARVPLIVTTFQNPVFESTAELSFSWAQNGLQLLTFRLSGARAVAVSTSVAESVRRCLGVGPAALVPNYSALRLSSTIAVDTPERRSARKRLGLELNAVVIANLARLHPQKGQPFLIQAFSQIAGAEPHAVLLIAGEGPSRARLEAQVAESGLQDQVRFLGWVKDPRGVTAAADVLVLASIFEGDSLALLEGMAAGLPYVATDVGSVRDVMADGRDGLIVPASDATALAEALRRLIRDPLLRERIGGAARNTVARLGAQPSSAARLESLYRSLLASPRSPRMDE